MGVAPSPSFFTNPVITWRSLHKSVSGRFVIMSYVDTSLSDTLFHLADIPMQNFISLT